MQRCGCPHGSSRSPVGYDDAPEDDVSTFISIMVYAMLVLAGLVAVSTGFIMLGRWIIGTTYDPDAEAH